MGDLTFLNANQVFTGILRQMCQEGKDITQHKNPIGAGDIRKMYDSGVLSVSSPETFVKQSVL